MNFYAFNIGDYAGATRHLSWDEDMAYRRMLDAYYSREAPLPLELRQVYRLVGASEQRQREAVDAVLEEFFERREDGWHNSRADEEIGKAKEKSATRSEKAENERERQRRHRARRKELFDRLRERGIVPHFDTPTAELEAMVSGHAPVTRTVTSAKSDIECNSDSHSPVTRDTPMETRDDANVTRDKTRDVAAVTPDATANNPNPNPNNKGRGVARARELETAEFLYSLPEIAKHPVRGDMILAPIINLMLEGIDFEQVIVPSIRRQAQHSAQLIDGWKYFVKGIRRDAQNPEGASHGPHPHRRSTPGQDMRDAIAAVKAHVAERD